ncbi:MAG: hypothetical protein QOE79_2113 [Sphingomonadales bacterium]|nr:hypothetical protein [Sphingomonadales bacterium]
MAIIRRVKIAVRVPSYGYPKFHWVGSLVAAVQHAGKAGHAVDYNGLKNTALAWARQAMAEEALRSGAEALIFCDDDHVFPEDAFTRLAGHEAEVVAANYPNRRAPSTEPTAYKLVGGKPEPVWTTPEKAAAGEIERVHGIGLGLCRIRTRVLERVPRPWFGGDREDAWFCRQLAAAGVPIHVDHALSIQVGHIDEGPRYFPR